ncbi:transglutaminase domain-containing protein [Lysobacter claricitrinus]|uniref:transglutaminase domain-containing protein n=1 Tax=Lysobacter claricitrinus TaxID=3367728 RepID=UPI0038B3C643
MIAAVTPVYAATRIPHVASPYKMSETALRGTIRYRLRLPDERWRVPETGEQVVVANDNGTVDLRVCAPGCDGAAPGTGDIARYLLANDWVDSDAIALRRFARDAAGGGPVARRMQRLVEAIRHHMDGPIAFDAYRSATQALRDRGGDCTEAAVLLAAAARAAGIPTRVMYGLVYSSRFTGVSHSFSPHMWVQAWDGVRWVSYDAGVGEFDAGHVALAIGDGRPTDAGAMMALIRGMQVVDAASVIAEPAR